MKGHHKKYTLHCEALSPIHIGSGEILSRWEYVVIGNQLYYTTDEFWQKLREIDVNAFNKLVESINSSNSASLTETFKTLRYKGILQDNLQRSSIEFKPRFKKNTTEPIIRNINRFSGASNYCIPGSSIKGAFRGAYEINKIDKEVLKTIDVNVIKTEDDKRVLLKQLDREFADLSLLGSNTSEKFRKIRIADVRIQSSDLVIVPISYAKDIENQNAADLYECIKPRTKFDVVIIDINEDNFFEQIMNKYVFSFYNAVFDKLKKQSDLRAQHLENFYCEAHKSIVRKEGEKIKRTPLIRCGYGSGQLSNSILMKWQELVGNSDTLLWQGKAKQLLQSGKMKPSHQYPSAPKWDLSNDSALGWIKINSCKYSE